MLTQSIGLSDSSCFWKRLLTFILCVKQLKFFFLKNDTLDCISSAEHLSGFLLTCSFVGFGEDFFF